jgi:ribosome-binding protein aMBF1 (putative translation factor)
MSNWKNILLAKNVPIIEPKIHPVRKVETNSNIITKEIVKEIENINKEVKVEYFGLKGKEIQKLRNEKKLTQKELATKLAIHMSDLQHIESGKAVFNNGLYKRIINMLSNN